MVLNDVISDINNGKYCAALVIDLTKVFDTVDHALLLALVNGLVSTCLIDKSV